MTTEQEKFWAGPFGDKYHQRNVGRINNNLVFFQQVFGFVHGTELGCAITPKSLIEFGAGMGENISALRLLFPECVLVGVDVNDKAIEEMIRAGHAHTVLKMSMQQWVVTGPTYDLSMTKGVLIHIAPDDLPTAYEVLYRTSRKWILICEYYSPTPVEINYRGKGNVAWKRDFAGEMLDKYKDLKLVDYGFRYHRDQYPQDDVHYWLMEKQQ